MERIEDMERRLAAQEAWGKWNTGPLANRIAKRRRELQTPLRRLVGDVTSRGLDGLALVAGWGFYLALMAWVVQSWPG